MNHYVVGIDLGGMSAKGAIFEENGTLILKNPCPPLLRTALTRRRNIWRNLRARWQKKRMRTIRK